MTKRADGQNLFGTAEVAEALGVSVSTVKRWIDMGVLPAERSAGGHRRLLGVEVVKAVRERGLPALDVSRLIGTRPVGALPVRAFTRALKAGEEREASTMLRDVRAAGFSMAAVADDLIAPAMHTIGELCASHTLDVGQEHRATRICVSALEAIKAGLKAPSRRAPRALGAAPSGDPYVLPTLLAEMVLREEGWDAIDLGPNTPFAALDAAAARVRARLVWLSVSHVSDEDRLDRGASQWCRSLSAKQVVIAVGGRAVTAGLRRSMVTATFGSRMADLVSAARQLHAPS